MNPDMKKLTKRLIELVAQLVDRPLEGDYLDTPFLDLGVDSLMALELAVYMEREFGIRLTEDELGTITNLRDILVIAEHKRS